MESTEPPKEYIPTAIATWSFGYNVTAIAGKCLMEGKSPVDSVEESIRSCELDEEIQSVGYGGLPNRDGIVQLGNICDKISIYVTWN
jgi:N4-(beta-N-acetylglucosaminyl)-L-asparaginase